MRFTLSDEQRRFAVSIRDLLAAADVPSVSRHWASGNVRPGLDLIGKLAALGVTGLAIPERWGGAGANPVDLAVAFAELGRHAVPGPLVESIAVVPTVLTGLGSESLGERWLPELAEGRGVATACRPPEVPYAVDADIARLILCLDADQLSTGEAVGPALTSVAASRRMFGVRPGTVLARDASVTERAFNMGALATAAYLLGAGRAVLDISCAYARQRVQFGRPIGSFQAVQHQLANVLVGLDLAEPLLFGAALTVGSRDVSAARVACADAAYRAARTALQVHGAIGYTLEHDLGRRLTVVRALMSAWGTQARHRERIATALAEGVVECPSH